MKSKVIKEFNLTVDEIIQEMLYHYHEFDILKEFDLNINNFTQDEIINSFNKFIIKNKQSITVKDMYNKLQNNYIFIDTPDGNCEVTDFYKKEKHQCFEIITNNHSCKSADTHRFEKDKENNWVFAKDLKLGDLLLTKNGYESIIEIKDLGISEVYDFTVNHTNERYWGGSGISSHNTGKSFLCYNICREAQEAGYSIVYIDTEFSIELDQLEGYGIDISPKKFMLLANNIIEDLKVTMAQLLDKLKEQKNAGKTLPKMLFVLDSVGQLGSRKEVEDALAGNEKADFTKAKALASFFRIIGADLGMLSIPLVATNHTYKCLTAGHTLQLANGDIKNIENITIGDIVKTLAGPKEVLNTVKYNDCNIIKIELENGEILRCTPEHRFLVKPEWVNDENDSCWKMAKELKNTDIILSIVNNNLKEINVIKVSLEDKTDATYDITVKDVHHYILGNGIISHNTMDMFPQDKMKGGCCEIFSKIQTRDGIKMIKDIVKGDYVLTLNGYEEVLETHNFDKQTIDFQLDRGETITVSKQHKFLINEDYLNESSWKTAEELNENDIILSFILSKLKQLRIVKKTESSSTQHVCDLTVANSHHYIDAYGIIHHNSGLFYSASSIGFLSKAKLKAGEEDDLDLGQSGIIVTCKMVKNRMAKPKKVKFEISFVSGCNPYVGLDFWCDEDTFDQVGIAKGKFDEKTKNFIPGGNRWYVGHLGKHVATADLFSPKVFTKDVLDNLRPIIQDYFKYKSITELNEINRRLEEAKGQITDKELYANEITSDKLFDADED